MSISRNQNGYYVSSLTGQTYDSMQSASSAESAWNITHPTTYTKMDVTPLTPSISSLSMAEITEFMSGRPVTIGGIKYVRDMDGGFTTAPSGANPLGVPAPGYAPAPSKPLAETPTPAPTTVGDDFEPGWKEIGGKWQYLTKDSEGIIRYNDFGPDGRNHDNKTAQELATSGSDSTVPVEQVRTDAEIIADKVAKFKPEWVNGRYAASIDRNTGEISYQDTDNEGRGPDGKFSTERISQRVRDNPAKWVQNSNGDWVWRKIDPSTGEPMDTAYDDNNKTKTQIDQEAADKSKQDRITQQKRDYPDGWQPDGKYRTVNPNTGELEYRDTDLNGFNQKGWNPVTGMNSQTGKNYDINGFDATGNKIYNPGTGAGGGKLSISPENYQSIAKVFGPDVAAKLLQDIGSNPQLTNPGTVAAGMDILSKKISDYDALTNQFNRDAWGQPDANGQGAGIFTNVLDRFNNQGSDYNQALGGLKTFAQDSRWKNLLGEPQVALGGDQAGASTSGSGLQGQLSTLNALIQKLAGSNVNDTVMPNGQKLIDYYRGSGGQVAQKEKAINDYMNNGYEGEITKLLGGGPNNIPGIADNLLKQANRSVYGDLTPEQLISGATPQNALLQKIQEQAAQSVAAKMGNPGRSGAYASAMSAGMAEPLLNYDQSLRQQSSGIFGNLLNTGMNNAGQNYQANLGEKNNLLTGVRNEWQNQTDNLLREKGINLDAFNSSGNVLQNQIGNVLNQRTSDLSGLQSFLNSQTGDLNNRMALGDRYAAQGNYYNNLSEADLSNMLASYMPYILDQNKDSNGQVDWGSLIKAIISGVGAVGATAIPGVGIPTAVGLGAGGIDSLGKFIESLRLGRSN
jgi:hypothetical protein